LMSGSLTSSKITLVHRIRSKISHFRNNSYSTTIWNLSYDVEIILPIKVLILLFYKKNAGIFFTNTRSYSKNPYELSQAISAYSRPSFLTSLI